MKIKFFFFAILIIVSFSSWLNNSLKYSAIFKSTFSRYIIDTSTFIKSYQGMAHVFKGNGSNTFDYIKLKKSGDIYYNNRKMAFNNVAKSYFDSTGSLTQEPVVWALTNSDSLPTINYTTNIGYPMNNSTIILPNTISKSNDLVINTGIFSNYDKIEFMLVPNYLSIVNPWNRIAGNCNQIVIPKCDLFLLPCSSVKLNLILIKNEEKIVSGKKFKFENRLSIVKIVNVTL